MRIRSTAEAEFEMCIRSTAEARFEMRIRSTADAEFKMRIRPLWHGLAEMRQGMSDKEKKIDKQADGSEKNPDKKNFIQGFIQEFKEFALQGNVFDMAVGVVIGTAFSNIIKSFINDLIMPCVGLLTAGKDFTQMKYSFGDGSAILYGDFIQNVVNFFIIAISIFLVVKFINAVRKPKPAEPPAPTDVDLLMEIRDLLKEQQKA
jgi:large conductance mechanosensitive channel